MEKRIRAAIVPDPLDAGRYGRLSGGFWRWTGSLALIALALVLPFTLSNYHVFELTMVLIYACLLYTSPSPRD